MKKIILATLLAASVATSFAVGNSPSLGGGQSGYEGSGRAPSGLVTSIVVKGVNGETVTCGYNPATNAHPATWSCTGAPAVSSITFSNSKYEGSATCVPATDNGWTCTKAGTSTRTFSPSGDNGNGRRS